MDGNITQFLYNASGAQSVNPYNQDLIIVLLLIIAFCQSFYVIHTLITDYYQIRKGK